jgi:hypothetical protein
LEQSIEGLVAESSSILPRRAVVAIAEHFEYASDTANREVDIKRPIGMRTRYKSSVTLAVMAIVLLSPSWSKEHGDVFSSTTKWSISRRHITTTTTAIIIHYY